MSTTLLAAFPSPSQGVWHLGPFPLRAYALFIIIGIIAALVIGDRRWEARGGERGVIYDIALWAVPFGLIGGRLYHVLTDWQTYFGADGAGPAAALRIWDGGLGIWGAVALGAVGAWIGCRRHGIPLPAFGDAIAPGIVLAQAIGRLGNYFNQELYGRPTDVPWGLEIFYRRDPSGIIDVHSLNGVSTGDVAYVVHPTFLYELLWNLLVFAALLYVDRRFKLGHGRLFALYVAGYCIGRFGVELLRDDFATLIAGIRINSFTATFVFIGAIVYFILAPKGREAPETLRGTGADAAPPRDGEDREPAVGVEKELVKAAATTGVVAAATVAVKEEAQPEATSAEGHRDDDPDAVATDADDVESDPEDQAIVEAEATADGDLVIASAALAEDAQLIDEDHDPVDEEDLDSLWGEADDEAEGPVSEQQEELDEPDAKVAVDQQAAAEEEAAEGEALIDEAEVESEAEPTADAELIDEDHDPVSADELDDITAEVSGAPVSEQQEELDQPDGKADVDEQAAAEEEAAEGEGAGSSSNDDDAELIIEEGLADLSEGDAAVVEPVSEQQEKLDPSEAKADVDEQAAVEEEAAEAVPAGSSSDDDAEGEVAEPVSEHQPDAKADVDEQAEVDDQVGEEQPAESEASASDYTVVTTPPAPGQGPVSRLGRLIRRRRG